MTCSANEMRKCWLRRRLCLTGFSCLAAEHEDSESICRADCVNQCVCVCVCVCVWCVWCVCVCVCVCVSITTVCVCNQCKQAGLLCWKHHRQSLWNMIGVNQQATVCVWCVWCVCVWCVCVCVVCVCVCVVCVWHTWLDNCTYSVLNSCKIYVCCL